MSLFQMLFGREAEEARLKKKYANVPLCVNCKWSRQDGVVGNFMRCEHPNNMRAKKVVTPGGVYSPPSIHWVVEPIWAYCSTLRGRGGFDICGIRGRWFKAKGK